MTGPSPSLDPRSARCGRRFRCSPSWSYTPWPGSGSCPRANFPGRSAVDAVPSSWRPSSESGTGTSRSASTVGATSSTFAPAGNSPPGVMSGPMAQSRDSTVWSPVRGRSGVLAGAESTPTRLERQDSILPRSVRKTTIRSGTSGCRSEPKASSAVTTWSTTRSPLAGSSSSSSACRSSASTSRPRHPVRCSRRAHAHED